MNPAVVARAVLTRLKADTTLYSGGAWTASLAGGSNYLRANPSSLLFPFIVYSVEWDSDNNFTGLDGPCVITFDIFDEVDQGTSRLELLIDRLIGDSMTGAAPGSRTAPTYGFHNHSLSLPASGSDNRQAAVSERWSLLRSSLGPSDTLQANQATVVFQGRVSNQAANP